MKMNVLVWWFEFSILVLFFKNGDAENPEVVTDVGVIRGLKASDGDYDMYMGIPYAHVNESNVWGESIPQPPFQEVFEAYDDSARCPQIEEFNNTVTGSLDCLHLNVYVPRTASPSKPLPVLVWVFGGYYMIGFHGRFLYGPKYLVQHDIIFVIFNYRLGPYGFMCLNTPEIPGNQGLKDQAKALQWIRDNIAAFGGDPYKVTVAGNSAGAASIDLHLRSEFEPLFDKVILESSASMLSVAPADLKYPIELAKATGYETNDVDNALDYLSSLPTDDVVLAADNIGKITLVCPEKQFPGVKRFLSDYSYNLDMPNAKNISFIIGNNDEEALLMSYFIVPELGFNAAFLIRLLLNMTFNFTLNELSVWSKLVSQFYLGDKPSVSDSILRTADFIADLTFVNPNEMLSLEALKNGAMNVYRYVFSYFGQRNFATSRVSIDFPVEAAGHADELGYLFDMELFDEPNEDDKLIIDRMTKMWANFVKYGDPTPSTSELLPLKWLPITASTAHYLEINKPLRTGTRNLNERMAFWDLFYSKLKPKLKYYNKPT